MTTQLQMPGGQIITLEADRVDELINKAFEQFAPRTGTSVLAVPSARVVDAQGYVLPGDGIAPDVGRIVTTGPYGAVDTSLNLGQLALDFLVASKSEGYRRRYKLVLLSPDRTKLNPFRAYWEFFGDWWSATVTLKTYPLPVGSRLKDNVTVLPDGLIPTCPVHTNAFHPHVYVEGVCFGSDVLALPGNGVINLCEAVYTLLRNPWHDKGHTILCMRNRV